MNAPDSPKPTAAAPASQPRLRSSASRAYGLWGVLPIYFKALADVPAVDIVAHRVLWSLPFLALLIFARREAGPRFAPRSRNRRTLGLLALTALLIGVNWLLYVYAVTSGHILAASFGYYLNPLANVLLGRFVLKERLTRLQWAAVAIAGAGISVLAAGALGQLWISLTLCVSFALYGLLRKIVAADALTGLGDRNRAPVPAARSAGWLGGRPAAQPVLRLDRSSKPAAAARRDRLDDAVAAVHRRRPARCAYSTLGMLQFLAPTLQFLIAVLLYGEPFTRAHAIAFAAIWTRARALRRRARCARRGCRSRPNDARQPGHVQPRFARSSASSR